MATAENRRPAAGRHGITASRRGWAGIGSACCPVEGTAAATAAAAAAARAQSGTHPPHPTQILPLRREGALADGRGRYSVVLVRYCKLINN